MLRCPLLDKYIIASNEQMKSGPNLSKIKHKISACIFSFQILRYCLFEKYVLIEDWTMEIKAERAQIKTKEKFNSVSRWLEIEDQTFFLICPSVHLNTMLYVFI